ncbi:hypothetical protein AB0I75_34100 [Streptomyces sp. NPDC050273]|uniref:hypothetical protein n=1 Tax=Streptomyces sp. NPDC050273 TaxID=3154933 RepID=UPI003438EF8D
MSAEPEPRPTTHNNPVARAARWVLHRRRVAAGQLFRGLCYGCGTALAGAISLWLQNRH